MAVLKEIIAIANESDSRKPIKLRHVDVEIVYGFESDREAASFLEVHPDRVHELRIHKIVHINGYVLA